MSYDSESARRSQILVVLGSPSLDVGFEMADLADMVGLSVSRTRRYVKQLEDQGKVHRVRTQRRSVVRAGRAPKVTRKSQKDSKQRKERNWVSHGAVRLLLVLADLSLKRGGKVCYTTKGLTKVMGIPSGSAGSVTRWSQELVSVGALLVERTGRRVTYEVVWKEAARFFPDFVRVEIEEARERMNDPKEALVAAGAEVLAEEMKRWRETRGSREPGWFLAGIEAMRVGLSRKNPKRKSTR